MRHMTFILVGWHPEGISVTKLIIGAIIPWRAATSLPIISALFIYLAPILSIILAVYMSIPLPHSFRDG